MTIIIIIINIITVAIANAPNVLFYIDKVCFSPVTGDPFKHMILFFTAFNWWH